MKLGILGNGKIVGDLLSFIGEVDQINLRAIASRKSSYEKTLALKEKYSIEKAYENFDQMLEDSQVETVYIGVPNNLHYEFSKKALLAGKNVICEKPFTANPVQLEKLIKIAGEKKLILL